MRSSTNAAAVVGLLLICAACSATVVDGRREPLSLQQTVDDFNDTMDEINHGMDNMDETIDEGMNDLNDEINDEIGKAAQLLCRATVRGEPANACTGATSKKPESSGQDAAQFDFHGLRRHYIGDSH